MKHSHTIIALATLLAVVGILAGASPTTEVAVQGNRTPAPTPLPTLSSAPSTSPATMVFTGDIMLSRSVGDLMVAKQDWVWPFRLIASVTAGADLAFANLESMISDRGTQQGCGYCFRADPQSVAGLQFAGFDVLSVSNNHAWDYGLEAFEDTVRHLRDAGIAAVGAGRTALIREVGGSRVAFLAYTDLLPASACGSVNCYEEASMAADIKTAAQKADIVIVSFHSGEEYVAANERQRVRYRAAIDAGADVVVGHHPHVVQEVERYGQGWIAYSLGNFVFDQNFSEATMTGMFLQATVDQGRIVAVTPRTVRISPQYQPSLLP